MLRPQGHGKEHRIGTDCSRIAINMDVIPDSSARRQSSSCAAKSGRPGIESTETDRRNGSPAWERLQWNRRGRAVAMGPAPRMGDASGPAMHRGGTGRRWRPRGSVYCDRVLKSKEFLPRSIMSAKTRRTQRDSSINHAGSTGFSAHRDHKAGRSGWLRRVPKKFVQEVDGLDEVGVEAGFWERRRSSSLP